MAFDERRSHWDLKYEQGLPSLEKPDPFYLSAFNQFVERELKLSGNVDLGGFAGMPQYDPVAKKVYVNPQDQNVLAVIDPSTDEVVAHFPVGRCKGNHGMALDPEHHRAFLSCEGNELMTVFNLDTHQPIAFLPMAGGPDVIKFDHGLKRIYVACSSGAISVFQMDDPDHYRKLEDFRFRHAPRLRARAGIRRKTSLANGGIRSVGES
jgi:hypothetical protein